MFRPLVCHRQGKVLSKLKTILQYLITDPKLHFTYFHNIKIYIYL
jgi:hypothetical protein